MASSSAASAGQSGPGKHRAGRKVRLRQLMARLRSGDLPEWVSGDDVFQLFSRYAPEALQAQTLGEWPMSTTLEFPLLQPAASTLRGTHQASQASEMPAVQYRPIWQRGSSGQITGRRLSMACCSPDGRPRGDWPVIGQPSRGGPSRQFQLIRSTARQANSLQDLRPRGQQDGKREAA
ncbi:hypothetical protein RF11_15675 [Thelohanellus kitauei]|uniref:Uncharacterized protein n=1 Tax=Thelohanellus kitauei TaxID=669202 RepID=A0A0C2MRN8_THEKT|nr:hypothetical protein RF11_15675 [Thelohanellus kitauei]